MFSSSLQFVNFNFFSLVVVFVVVAVELTIEFKKEKFFPKFDWIEKTWKVGRKSNLIMREKVFPIPGIEPEPPGWEPGILTTRP